MDFRKETVLFLEENGERYAEVIITDEGGDVYNIRRTYVSDDHRGEGLAAKLVDEAVRYITGLGGKMIPGCSYAARYFEKNGIEAYTAE